MGDHGGNGGVTCSGLRYRLPSPHHRLLRRMSVENSSSTS
jgi:hypothetical protein